MKQTLPKYVYKRHTELNLKFIKIGAKNIPKWRKAFAAVVIYIAQVGSKAILEKAQNTNEGLTKEVPIV